MTATLALAAKAALDSATCLQNQWKQVLGVLIAAVMVSVIMALIRWSIRRSIEPRTKTVSFGGLWISAALLLAVIYLLFVAFLAVTGGGSFERFVFEHLGLAKALPSVASCLPANAEKLWSLATPFYFPILYAGIHMLFILLVFLLLWGLVGFRQAFAAPRAAKKKTDSNSPDEQPDDESQSAESVAPMPEGLLAPALGPIFQVFGYWMDLKHLEARHKAYFDALVFTLRVAKWLALPAAFLGTLPATAWIVMALLIGALHDNLRAPVTAQAKANKETSKATEPKPEQKSVSIDAILKTLAKEHQGLEMKPMGARQAVPGRTVESDHLDKAAAMALVSEKLGLNHQLYAHQEACFTHLDAGENVLLATAPLSGRTTVGDLLALDQVLTKGQAVLFLCPSTESARQRRQALSSVLSRANWDWNVYVHDLCNDPPQSLDLNMRQPHVLFVTAEVLHAQFLPNARDWELFLRGLGLVIVLGVESYRGAQGANFYRLARRFQNVCNQYGAQPRYFSTAVPYSLEIRSFAESLIGVPLTYVGPGMDTAPEPSREIPTARQRTIQSTAEDVPLPVLVAGLVSGLGHKAELFGFDETLTREEQDRIAEVLLNLGKADLGTSTHEVKGGAGVCAPRRRAEVVVAQADASQVRLMHELTRHFGADLVEMSVTLETINQRTTEKVQKGFAAQSLDFGLSEAAFGGAKPPSPHPQASPTDEEAAAKDEPEQTGEPSNANPARQPTSDQPVDGDTGQNTSVQTRTPTQQVDETEQTDAASGETKTSQDDGHHFSQATSATIVLPAPQPFVDLLISQGLVGSDKRHPYLGLGCELVTNPDNELARRKNLRCAMAESAWTKEDLVTEFGRNLVQQEMAVIADAGHLAHEQRIEMNAVTGLVHQVPVLRYVGHPLPHRSVSMDTVADRHVTVVDRHTRTQLRRLDRVRALADAYPGMVLLASGRRYRICGPEDQVAFDEGFIYADPYERPVISSKIRTMTFELAHPERREQSRRSANRSHQVASPTSKAPALSHKETGLGTFSPKAKTDGTKTASSNTSGPAGPQANLDERRTQETDRRAAMAHSIGGSAFFLWYPWVLLHEWVAGVKTYDRTGQLLDVTYYADPIETRYRTKAAVLAFPTQAPSKAVLHGLVHLFGHVLPAFVRHDAFDLDIAFAESYGPYELPAIAFIDRHPGDAGFARAVTTEVLKHLCYWSYRMMADCPAHCESPYGCFSCMRSLQCHATHGQAETDMDREATMSLLEELMGGFIR